MKIGYGRVSSLRQKKEGFSLEFQEKSLLEAGADVVYTEQFTGKKMDRPVFDKVNKMLKEGDTLMVTRLDRMARTLGGGIETINELLERGVNVHILNMGMLDNTPASKLIRNIFLCFADYEREMLLERMAEGKEIARLKAEFKEGRPKLYKKVMIDHAMELLETKSYRNVAELTGISVSTLTRENRRRAKKHYMSRLKEKDKQKKVS